MDDPGPRHAHGYAAIIHDVATGFGTASSDRGPLRVLLDASSIKQSGQGGIRSYTLGLARTLARSEYLAITAVTPHPDDFESAPIEVVNLSVAVGSPLARARWRETRLKSLVRKHRAQVVIMPLHEHPIRSLGVPSVMVMHDIGPLVAPALYGRARWTRYLLTLPGSMRRATAVVSMSHATQKDVLANFHVDPSKCHVIETGTQPLPMSSVGSPVVGDYALYVGTLMRHKNIETLVRAFGQDEARRLPAKLVLAGPHSPEEQHEVREWACRYGLPLDRLVLMGYVTIDTLATLYQGAAVCVLPSLHEGFGAPVIEAMRLGIPFVASDIPAHREVAQDAALYVSAHYSPTAWRDAIARLYADEALRQELAHKGLDRAAYYTWDRIGAEWEDLLKSLAAPN